jgi:hypothetical protein
VTLRIPRPRLPRRAAVALTIATIAIGVPLGVSLASHQFSDVPNSNIFHADIDAIAASGVTTGCGGGRYCPSDFVTREQMAAFMNRLGALGPGKIPVVNADRLDGLHASQLVRAAAATAGNLGDPCGGGAIFTAFESTDFTTAVGRQVTAPTAGVLLVFGRVSAERASSSVGDLRLLGRLTVNDAQVGGQAENSYDDLVTQTCQEGRTMSLSGAHPVAAGTHSVALQIAKSTTTGGTGTAWVGNASVSTLFVPFGNDGGQGTIGLVEYLAGTTTEGENR